MTDNITVPGQGKVLATDEIDLVHWPKSKIVFGPNGTAIDVSDFNHFPVTTRPDLYELFAIEGEPWCASAFTVAAGVSVASGDTNSNLTSVGTNATIGKCFWIETMTLGISQQAVAQAQISQDANSLFQQLLDQTLLTGTITMPVKKWIRPYMGGVTLSLNCRRVTGAAGATTMFGSISLQGYKMTDDLDFDANYTMLVIGDSIENGTGPTTTANMWPFLVKADQRATYGKRARVILQSTSSSTTSLHETWRAAGRYDPIQPDIIFYKLGTNDAGASTVSATYTANITAMWTYASKRWPNATLVIVGTPPLTNNTAEGFAATYRTAAAAYVTAQANSRLKFIDLGSTFDRTNAANYAGDGTHPNNTGHAAIASTINAAIASQGISL